jgi:hypothetical protein
MLANNILKAHRRAIMRPPSRCQQSEMTLRTLPNFRSLSPQTHLTRTPKRIASEPLPSTEYPRGRARAVIPPTGSLANMEACTSASVHFFFIAPMLANVPQ